jgi:triosephosphate isomerase (TIM)
MRKKMIAGNWKMNKTIPESVALAGSIRDSARVDVLIAPSFVALSSVKDAIAKMGILISAQNMHFEESGAFTGELSPLMLKSAGCTHVIIGHSERRHLFNESDDFINKKIRSALSHNLKIIFCIGEKKEERDAGNADFVLKAQLSAGLKEVQDIKDIIIAYEPVWAIGTGDVASPKQVEQAHNFIREEIRKTYGSAVADELRILYGGSVNPKNADSLLSLHDVDGALVGGASLNAESFNSLVEIGEKYI